MTSGDRARRLPTVSVIVPVYNAANVLPTTLPSWLGQDTTAEWILVDDGSDDGSAALIEKAIRAHPNVRLVRHASNRGRAAARNTGIGAAGGDVLLFLDADMRPATDFVGVHTQLHADPDVIGVVSHAVLEGLDERDPYHRYLRSRSGAKGHPAGQPIPFKHFIIGYTSVKAHAVHAVGGFDERFSYGEDIDFAYRLWQRHPEGLTYSDRAIVHHFDHGTLEARLTKLDEFGRRNLPLLLTKHEDIARLANLDFVDSPRLPSRLRGALVGHRLRLPIARVAEWLLPHAPARVSNVLVRYLCAHRIARAFRQSPSRAPRHASPQPDVPEHS